MFNSPIIDLVILLSFTYFIGALLLAAINEGITQGMFRLRQRGLKHSIENLFFNDSSWLSYVKGTFLKSPHITSLMRKSDAYPAYIPSNNFVLAVIQGIGSENYNSAALKDGINKSALPNELKVVLIDLAAKAGNNLTEFEKNLSKFYDDAMDRAGGWYKKRIRRILLLVGFILSVTLNIDTIKITNDALGDADKLSQTVDKIVSELPDIKHSGSDTISIKGKQGSV